MTDSVFKANLAHLGGVQILGRLTAGLRRWRDRNGLRDLIDARLAERELRARGPGPI